jgi:hypothetical protein
MHIHMWVRCASLVGRAQRGGVLRVVIRRVCMDRAPRARPLSPLREWEHLEHLEEKRVTRPGSHVSFVRDSIAVLCA